MTPQERRCLIDALLEGEISEADFIRLEAEFSLDPAAREDYYQRLTLQVLLDAEAEEHSAEARKIAPAGRRPRFHAVRRWAIAASVLVLVGVVTAVIFRPPPVRHTAAVGAAEERVRGFAVITGQVNPVWKDSISLADGAMVPAGTLRLASGVVQVELFSGVTAVIEGDAEFAIASPMEMSVSRGKVRAFVPPPAQGFRIVTPGGDVVDLGTEFAMDVSAGGAEVHVLHGQIEWHEQKREKQIMSEGQAVRWTSGGGGSTGLTADAGKFIGVAELARRRDAARSERKASWQRYGQALRDDRRTLAYYRMAAPDAWSRLIPNDASANAGAASDGVVVATSRDADRWGEAAGALDFSRAGSRLRLNVPGELRSLTMFCWVKINSLDRLYNSLLLTDGHEVGAPHWQIMNDGRLFFSVKKHDGQAGDGRPDKHNFYSSPIWTPAQSGRWMMLAVTYDVDARLVTHFANGRVVGGERVPDGYLVQSVRIGDASIGNWSEPAYRKDAEFAVRNLNGSVGEFALVAAALSPETIAEIYDHGKP